MTIGPILCGFYEITWGIRGYYINKILTLHTAAKTTKILAMIRVLFSKGKFRLCEEINSGTLFIAKSFDRWWAGGGTGELNN